MLLVYTSAVASLPCESGLCRKQYLHPFKLPTIRIRRLCTHHREHLQTLGSPPNHYGCAVDA
jgi:hypothetical protein